MRGRPPIAAHAISVALALLLLAPAAVPQKQLPQRPKLIVVIVVDQMRADYIPRFRSEWHGGLARLVNQGAWFRNAAYPYADTETCPGHATIGTGVFPATHGIIGNVWLDRASSQVVTCTQDMAVKSIGIGRTVSPGDSAAQLKAPSFAERLRAARPGSRVVTLSLKARAAIMLAGHRADAVVWQDEVVGDWLTSSAYGSELPSFARDFVAHNPLTAGAAGKVWQLTLSPEMYKGGQSEAGEAPAGGWGTTFPHALASNDRFVARWRASPFADEYLEQLAVAAVHTMNLGRGPATDFLGISFSAPDYVGHAFGPASREAEDEYLRLDRTIGKLLDELDENVGPGNYTVALTADHGVAPIPEQSATGAGGRVNGAAITAAAEKVLDRRLGEGRHILQVVGTDIYLAPGVQQKIDGDPALWRELQAAILGQTGVAGVFESAKLSRKSAAKGVEQAEALAQFPGRSGDLTIALKPYWILSSGGTTHGTANEYDQRIPILFYGAGIKPGEYANASSPADIAPTLAALTGVLLPRTEGHALAVAMRAAPTAKH